jgi:hypothetical protein
MNIVIEKTFQDETNEGEENSAQIMYDEDLNGENTPLGLRNQMNSERRNIKNRDSSPMLVTKHGTFLDR